MNYLSTKTIQVGQESFLLSEFTPLDRIHDLEFSLNAPEITKPDETADIEERKIYLMKMESWSLKQFSHSIALSLAHSMPEKSVDSLMEMIQHHWSQRALNSAYDVLRSLNSGDEESTQGEGDDISVGKSLSPFGRLQPIWPWNWGK